MSRQGVEGIKSKRRQGVAMAGQRVRWSAGDHGVYPAIVRQPRQKVKDLVWDRAGNRSELSGSRTNLEVAHINHASADPDDPANLKLMTIREHLQDHERRDDDPSLGLTREQNRHAIAIIRARLRQAIKRQGGIDYDRF